MKRKNILYVMVILLVLMLLLLDFSIVISQTNYTFKQVMPRSQWMDYSPDQPERAVILDDEGGAIVASVALGPVWLLVQKIDRYGNVVWAEPGQARKVALDTPYEDENYAPIMLSDGDGGVFITYAYCDVTYDTLVYLQYDVYVQHISRNFERLWGDRGIAVAASDSIIQEYPYGLVKDGEDGLFILYTGHSEGQGAYGTKYVQHISESGKLLWADLGIILTKNDTAGVQRILPDDEGGAFLFGYENYAQRINHKGEFLWALPFVKTGLPKVTRLWLYRTIELNKPYITVIGNFVGAQKISENDGSIFWGENGKLWKPDNKPNSGPTIITKNGKGGAYIFLYHFLQEMDEYGNYLYETPKAVLDTTLFESNPVPVSGEYAEGLGAFVLYVNSTSFDEGELILQKINDDGSLPWGPGGITVCDTNVFLNQSHSIIRVDDQHKEAFVFVEFQQGIFVKKVDLTTGEDITHVQHNNKNKPLDFQLSVYPNPFMHSINIQITGLKDSTSPITLKVYNILGKEVVDLTDNLKSNSHIVNWKGGDSLNRDIVSGIYFIRVESNHRVNIQKILKLN